jgi:hypothetical protein
VYAAFRRPTVPAVRVTWTGTPAPEPDRLEVASRWFKNCLEYFGPMSPLSDETDLLTSALTEPLKHVIQSAKL